MFISPTYLTHWQRSDIIRQRTAAECLFSRGFMKQRLRNNFGLDDVQPIQKSEWAEDENNYYILNIAGTTPLQQGFRYVKELLLQHHKFQMYCDYQTLMSNGIDVFSVKCGRP